MKITQLGRLRASERCGRTLRNTVEVHHAYVVKLLTSRASYLTHKQTWRKGTISERQVISITPSYGTYPTAKQQ